MIVRDAVVQFEEVRFALVDRKSQMDGLFLFEDFVLGNCRISTGKSFCHHFLWQKSV